MGVRWPAARSPVELLRDAVELAVSLSAQRGNNLTNILAAAFFAVSLVFVWRSFYAMRITNAPESA